MEGWIRGENKRIVKWGGGGVEKGARETRTNSAYNVGPVEEVVVRRGRGRGTRREERRGRELCVLRPAHAFRDPRLNLSTFFSAYSHPQECVWCTVPPCALMESGRMRIFFLRFGNREKLQNTEDRAEENLTLGCSYFDEGLSFWDSCTLLLHTRSDKSDVRSRIIWIVCWLVWLP